MNARPDDIFGDPVPDPRPAEDAFVVDVDGFEGPLDLLLALARTQKVDLLRISISTLAGQYLGFVEAARQLRLELAADYLVMAAWLAYLKSRLLLPEPESGEDEPTGEELAARLAHRLRRLDAMREAARQLMARPQLGADVFARGAPEPAAVATRVVHEASLYDLLTAYAAQRAVATARRVTVRRRPVLSLNDALEVLGRLIGTAAGWTPLASLLPAFARFGVGSASLAASTFSASLELVRTGQADIRQGSAFAPLYVRRRAAAAEGDRADAA